MKQKAAMMIVKKMLKKIGITANDETIDLIEWNDKKIIFYDMNGGYLYRIIWSDTKDRFEMFSDFINCK